ncbi:LytTR family transcriptional regulator [Ruminococcaceae bacterium OttesenSCG-928-I18]|nr:LytTR family transcriptional regulator [Ruminococcaceae bacterium OttesenSCG-928-I18]
MRLRIELEEGLEEPEVVIRCGQVDEQVLKIQSYIAQLPEQAPKFVFYKGDCEYYLPMEEILFFETEGERVYAHTKQEAYRTKYRLYELEESLPRSFVRASKSTIVNIEKIYAITRNVAGASGVQFSETHKQIYISRHYYRALKQRLGERRRG